MLFSKIWRLLLAGLLTVLGLALLATPGFQFSALLCFGAALILAVFFLLSLPGLKRRTPVKWLRRILSLLLCLGIAAAAFTGVLIARGGVQQDTPCQYVIVLGAGVNGTQPSLILSDRLRATLSYLQENPNTVCIVSGGQGPGEEITEADCMAQWLLEKGISEDRIWREDRATSTYENILFSLALIEEKTGQAPAAAGIISNEFHLYRAGLTAKAAGLAPIPIPAKTSWVSLRINYFLREIPALWLYWLRGNA